MEDADHDRQGRRRDRHEREDAPGPEHPVGHLAPGLSAERHQIPRPTGSPAAPKRCVSMRPAKFVTIVITSRTSPTSARAWTAMPVASVNAPSRMAAMVAAMVENGSKMLCGYTFNAFPLMIRTAMVSPSARAQPSNEAATIPVRM